MIRRLPIWAFLVIASLLEIITIAVGVLGGGMSLKEVKEKALPVPEED